MGLKGAIEKSLGVLIPLALLVPAILLGLGAVSRLPSALALEAAFPIPDYLAMNYPVPPSAYAQGERILGEANTSDGETHIFEAQAQMLSGQPGLEPALILDSALHHAPASALGWTLLAEAQSARDQMRAAKSLAIAFSLSPFDYLLAPRQALVASSLWPALTEETKSEAVKRVRLLWSELPLRTDLLALAASENGAALVTSAFADEPEELRAVNRWFASELRRIVEPL